MKKIVYALVFLVSLLTVISCSNESTHSIDSNQSGMAMRQTRDGVEIISNENFEILRNEALHLFKSGDLHLIFSEPGMDFQTSMDLIRESGEEDLERDDFQRILGENYNELYFENLGELMQITTNLYQSELFNSKASMDSRLPIIEEILIFVFENGIPVTAYSCGDGYKPCVKKADAEHKKRMGVASASAGLTLLVSGGAGAPFAIGGWVIGMIGSGAQYDIDMEYCFDKYCG